MRGYRGFAITQLVVILGICAGCRSGPPANDRFSEPSSLRDGRRRYRGRGWRRTRTPVRTTGVVDRHPLLSKPRDYWESSGDNKVVKAAAATFVGVPAGIYGEVKQIFVGVPPEPKY